MRHLATVALACGLALATAGAARADTIVVGGGWQAFSWDNAPGSFNNEGALTFTSGVATKLTVTDAYLDGDRFQVFDNGTSLGLTSVPTSDGFSVFNNADAARADSRFSSGVFALAPGSHAITIQITAIASGYPGGTGYLRADAVDPTATPEPAGLTLLAAAAACWAGARWRRVRRVLTPPCREVNTAVNPV